MATHSRILAWEIQWTEEPSRPWCLWCRQESDRTEQLTQEVTMVAHSAYGGHLFWSCPPGDLRLIIPGTLCAEPVYGERAVVGGQGHPLCHLLWPLKNQCMETPVSSVRHVRTTGPLCSVTVVLLAWREGRATGCVERQRGDC